MSLDRQIEHAVAKLLGGEDPEEVLRAFAGEVQSTPVVETEEVHSCSSCGEEEVLCFSCKVRDTVGEQAMMALPMVLPKIMEMAKQALTEAAQARRQRKAAESAQAQAGQRRHAYGEPGPQKF